MHEFYRHRFDLFARMERWPYADIVRYQTMLVEKLARHVRLHVPVFAERVRPLFDGEAFRIDCWREVPILTRQELRAATPALEAIELPAEMGGTRTFSTSGSTGEPVKGRHTDLSSATMTCMRERLYRWHRFDPDNRMAFIFLWQSGDASWPEGASGGNWSPSGQNGTTHRLDLLTPIDQQIDWLERARPDYLSTTASNLHELALAVRHAGIELPIEAGVAVSSRLYPQIRTVASEVFGMRSVEAYGSEETGIMAVQCEESELLHVCVDHVILEVLDEDGEPVGRGGNGRVVVTDLHNFATPLLRYEIGDLAETAVEACPCGRTFPVLKSIAGRMRQPIVFPDGARLNPHMIIKALQAPDLLPAVHFQIAQTAPDAFEVRYVPDRMNGQPDESAIREKFRTMVHPHARLNFAPVERIERAANGKFEDFIYFKGR